MSTITRAHEQFIESERTDGDGKPGFDVSQPPANSTDQRDNNSGTDDPRWVRPALVALLGTTAVLYLWGLGASGWANSFYSAAAQAGSVSWKAWFFGSSDAANAITVDKPPAALWVMGLSARIFGVNAWSILVPQALAGVASVGVLYATVKRWFGPIAGLIAAGVLATTPVATLMFRFNNPDALLVLVLICSAWCLIRALETTATKWVIACWSLVGFAFLTKMLQALMVAPAFALVYLICADTSLRRRFTQSIVGLVALVASAGWYVAIVEAWPKSARPYIGGSQHNSMVELILGYNGFGRLTGNETGSANNGGQWGATGWSRLFNNEFGSQASWLLPAALVLLIAGLWWTRKNPRTDRTRASLCIWGGWLLVTACAFSFGQGIIHPYYTVALAPAIGALVGIGGVLAWRQRTNWLGKIVLACAVGGTAIWSHVLLSRSDWMSWLAGVVLAAGLCMAALVLSMPRRHARVLLASILVGLGVGLLGPTAYSIQTASSAHAGALPSAGPNQGNGPGFGGRPGGFARPQGQNGMGQNRGGASAGFAPRVGFQGAPGPQMNGMPGGLPTGPPSGMPRPMNGSANGGTPRFRGAPAMRNAANAGGLLNASQSTPAITAKLKASAGKHRWAAAAVGSNSASGFQLASGKPVMAIGGFNGSDPSPTLAQFMTFVTNGDIGYFIATGTGANMGGGPPGLRGSASSTSGQISAWVKANFTSTTVDGVTLYDLTNPKHPT